MFEEDHLKFPFSEVAAATRSDLVETMQSCDMQDSSSDWIPERHKKLTTVIAMGQGHELTTKKT